MSKDTENQNGAEWSETLWERRQREQENAILDAANALINERGFEAMTMDDLAERAGISKPTLYKRFPSKEAVAVRATLQLLEDGLAEIQAHPTEWTAARRFTAVVAWMVGEMHDRKARPAWQRKGDAGPGHSRQPGLPSPF